MTLTIKLTEEEEKRLTTMAERAGVDQETLIRQLIGGAKAEAAYCPRTPAEAIEYWKANGILGSYGDPNIDSPQLARDLRHRAESRDRS